jgi:hypothetical protein
MWDFQKRGYSMRGIAAELEKRTVQTPRGGSWHPQLIPAAGVVRRAAALRDKERERGRRQRARRCRVAVATTP